MVYQKVKNINIYKIMAFSKLIIVGGILFLLLSKAYSHACLKTPNGVRRLKNINDIDRYIIVINGNPKTYTPGQTYNVSLQVNPNISAKKFKHFILTLENERDSTTDNLYHSSGRFGLFETGVMAKFDEDCRNTVIENGKMPKTEIQVYWVAPPENSGCIYIKATVVESYDNWFSEDGQLTKKLCEDNTDEDFKPLIVETCCSCQEAKYEVAFEGRWTRNTHPKGYPSDVWSTKFSDIIGISHERGNAFWSEGMLASDGLKDLADTGTTNTLESELKGMGDNIRTIIKARGLAYPNITSSSYAVFRVDHKNHLVSLVSKIIPSPDWIVGVSNFELCQKDCTWAESHTYNLYPIDVGTNDGIEYLSSAKRNRRREITPITPNNPNDPRSPFYSEDGEPMNPIVKLHFTRQKVYGEMCSDGGSEDPSVDSKDPGEESETERNVAEEIQARERTSKNAGDEEGSDGEVEDKRECAEGENCEVEER
ncbi:hypothetical protein JTB14_002246 [Gonioctena quinquepunctata]|nr:hypothetical protein JTB14_002246 [Gonioctena quinquepunctata]